MHGPFTIQDKRVYVLGLFKCPVTANNPQDCQLNCARNNCISFREWIDYVNGLSDEEVDKLYFNHKMCVCHKDDITLTRKHNH
jgi:hypothetical protein